jgi:hypothetical protein
MADPKGLKIHVDMDKMQEVLKTQPRFTVSSTLGGKETTLIEAMKVKPGVAASDNQVNVLC